jgi:vacuolar-type H+-ATPase subunit E/Vma4
MEELQSTEVLDREILEDARKKAFKILKDTEDSVKASAENWKQQTKDAMADLEKHYADRRQEALVEILARLPLEMRRMWSEKVEGFLGAAVDAWFGALSRSQVLELLDQELGERLAVCPEFAEAQTIRVGISSLSQAEAGDMIKKRLSKAALVFENISPRDESPGREGGKTDYPELVLDIPAVKLTASIRQAVNFRLLNQRAELIEALLGPDALVGPKDLPGSTVSEGAQG